MNVDHRFVGAVADECYILSSLILNFEVFSFRRL